MSSIRLYGGARDKLPKLSEREPGFCTDTGELFVGTEEGNLLLASGSGVMAVEDGGPVCITRAGGRIPLASRGAAVADVSDTAGIDEVIGALNSLIAVLRASGALEE